MVLVVTVAVCVAVVVEVAVAVAEVDVVVVVVVDVMVVVVVVDSQFKKCPFINDTTIAFNVTTAAEASATGREGYMMPLDAQRHRYNADVN